MLRRIAVVLMAASVFGALIPVAGAHVQKSQDTQGDTDYAPLDVKAASFKETKKEFTLTLNTYAPVPPSSLEFEGNEASSIGMSFFHDFDENLFYDAWIYPENGKWKAGAMRTYWPTDGTEPSWTEIPVKLQNKSNSNFKIVLKRKHAPEGKKGDTLFWYGYTWYGQGDDPEGVCFDDFLAGEFPESGRLPFLGRFAQEGEGEEPPEGNYGCSDSVPDDDWAAHMLKK